MRDRKLVMVSGEEALIVSHLSAFSYISADGTDVTSFQGLSIEEEGSKKIETFMASLKDAQMAVREGVTPSWEQLIQLCHTPFFDQFLFSSFFGPVVFSSFQTKFRQKDILKYLIL
jgi:hypothetical protein